MTLFAALAVLRRPLECTLLIGKFPSGWGSRAGTVFKELRYAACHFRF
jgi:hypothetical protein